MNRMYLVPVHPGSGRLAQYVPVWGPSVGALGAVGGGGGGLGSARAVADQEIVTPDAVYTYRTWSKVPIDPERDVELRVPEGTSGLGVLPLIAIAAAAYGVYRGLAGGTAWEAAEDLGWRISAPRGHASFWQNTTRERSPEGWMGYKTSLNVTPTTQGVKASALKWAARRILSFMSGSGSPNDVSNIAQGTLYERSARAESAGLLRRASEAVLGRETTQRATELGREIATEAEAAIMGSTAEREAREAAHSERMIYGYVGAGLAFLLGVFLATRRGSAKVERKLGAAHERVTRGVTETAVQAAFPMASAWRPRQANRRRRNAVASTSFPVGSRAWWRPSRAVVRLLMKHQLGWVGDRVTVVSPDWGTHAEQGEWRRVRFSGGGIMNVPLAELRRS